MQGSEPATPQQPPTAPTTPKNTVPSTPPPLYSPQPQHQGQLQPYPGTPTQAPYPQQQQQAYVGSPVQPCYPASVAGYLSPVCIVCPYCQVAVTTRTETGVSDTDVIIILLLVLLLGPLALLFCLCPLYGTVTHYCTRCNNSLGRAR